ncbi:unnamed protein product [Rhizophagus irregularis]|nr:unnamed protein product [Rhizophagus irregularis]
MKHDIFNEWLSELDCEFHLQGWHVVLIIDNTLSHKFVTSIDKNKIDNDYNDDYKDDLTNDKSEESLDDNETNNISK